MKFFTMTFNLRVHVESDGHNAWPNRVRSAGAAIANSGAAWIGTQEGTVAMLQDLQAQLPGYEWVGSGRSADLGGEYCAIFYNKEELEVKESGQFWLSETPEQPGSSSWDSGCPRICTWARFAFLRYPGKECMAYNTHLDHLSQEAREKGIVLVCEAMQRHRQTYGGLPAIVTGDMNAQPDNSVVRYLRGQGKLGGSRLALELRDAFEAYAPTDGINGLGCTFHGYSGETAGEPIDYIFATQEIGFTQTVIDRRQYGGIYPSDHYPVIAEVEID
jgi:endonuclease/exonuclease/phosphatase family metal-dependent hydrolase